MVPFMLPFFVVLFALGPIATAEFVAVEQVSLINSAPFKLARVDRLHIPYVNIAYNSTVSGLPAFALSLDAQFEAALSPTQFDALMETYAFSATTSRVKFRPGTRYRLTDFLPPIMQATNTLHFHTQFRY